MDWDDPEPIDLEPIDPGSDRESRFDRDGVRDRRTGVVWIVVVGVGLAAWAAIALTNPGNHNKAVPPTPTPTSAAPPDAFPPAVDRITTLAPHLWEGLRGVGTGRFAMVVDDRLYLLNEAGAEAQTTLVPLPQGHVTIDDQNGSSLLASTFQQTLVSTAPVGTRTLSVRDGAIRAFATAQWWLGRGDGTLRDDRTGAVSHTPSGLRVVAAIQQGFLALDATSRWVVWSKTGTTIVSSSGGQLLATGKHVIAILYSCSDSICPVEVVDTGAGTSGILQMKFVPQFAAFSPDDTRLALTSAAGEVYVLDATTLHRVFQTSSEHAPVTSLPLAWTSDSRTLLVTRANQVDIMRATDGALIGTVSGTSGLEQLLALP